jgi:hypothetical protein
MSRREDYSSDYDDRKCQCSKCIKKYEICYERNRCDNKIKYNCYCRHCSTKRNEYSERNQDRCYNDFNDDCKNNTCKNKKVIVITIN